MIYTLNGLRNLHKDMKSKHKSREKYSFVKWNARFEVIFLIDRNPYELLVGVVGSKGQHYAFIIEVHCGFKAELPNAIFFPLCKILRLRPAKDDFTSFVFLMELSNRAPTACTTETVQPHEVAAYHRRDIPDNEKIYFLGWNDHWADGRKARNIEKTRKLLGDAVADFCQRNNISSMWTDAYRESRPYTDPPGFTSILR